ncbi:MULTISPECIES: acetyl-CoA carboxylase biotin carboxylase subunit [unclassified Actinopolyspora]|uniref:acetyl-CoA carboxylase biotin carboxylase subunit n=1 Tax=unclassified Actinopolyspora TaxID=2639451 RepID=UPI0013F69531|nr:MULTISPECIES: acetyl-CoA carboxylase biotin carboxylase subunit [unclassified Actinopolyspora]NHD17014.1 acetyl-CoA carboxylase biotin carboxylase subunit [Actinopolyspora sp. BKK2]NHE76166.1 acetyl-CoA carboxylase biotin carboxylase subunit [Actinopolyspora sp. BKK1]
MTGRSRILVANRGEIAVRIVRACHTAGHEAVAVYSDTDKNARWVRMADEALHIGGSPAAKSYLNTDAILEAAKYAEVDAVHPGYGFLSENAAFARAVTAAGFTFIGPPPEVIELMGDKASARSAATEAGVPVVPGSRPVTDTDDAVRVAEEIGYPILVKAAAGGGGRGIRPVRDAEQLTEVFAGARAEAQSAFGDGTAYLERALPGARHIEVQLLADHHGNLVHLFERDCSVQRRRQKLLEEAPAPDLDERTRNELGEAAKRLGEHVGYRNAGTVEFLVDPDGRFYFIEMNTRVQVEHPITEAITGVDLVAEQLRIADGAELSLTQDAVRHSGAAVELRINAEDPDNGFLPTPGEITAFEAPGGPGVRLDTALTSGEQISPFYDSLIAKLVCWGADRRQAYARARQALSEFRVEGVASTIPLHRELIDDRELLGGPVHTTWLEERS